ncbi:MAG: hypothetical protein KO464_01075 [Candidatus Methanofastidiosum sp.]|nr:hypothetical protein [Methanofastidiosum sp.]
MKKFISLVVLAFLVAPAVTFGQVMGPGVELPTPIQNTSDIFGTIQTLINWFFYVLLVLAVIFILVVALNYVTSGGKDDKVKENGRRLAFILVGLAVAVLAKGLVFVTCNLVSGRDGACNF